MIYAIKFAELAPWPMWAKIWVGFWLGIALFCFVLAVKQYRAKRKQLILGNFSVCITYSIRIEAYNVIQ
jgi:hypothetical protein